MTTKQSSKSTTDLAKSRDKLVEDLKTLIADAQSITEEAKSASGEAIEEKIATLKKQLQDGIKQLNEQGQAAKVKATECSDDFEELVRAHPWRSVGIAAAAGFVLSLFLRKDR